MRYYVTGANGFIGQNLVKWLCNVVPLRRDYLAWLAFNITEANPFSVIHLSAYGNHYYQQNQTEVIQRNVTDLNNMLDVLRTSKSCLKFYNISTSSIQLPTRTLYSVSKELGEKLVESYQDPRFVNVRPYSVYGPGEADHRFIPTVIRALHSGETIQLDEEAYHDWIHVDDFISAMFNGYTNIGTGVSYQNLDIVLMLEAISGKKLNYTKAKLRSYDTKDWVCPEGVPHRDIYEGLKQTYEFFTQKNKGDKQKA